jgi:hypothetical protein
MIILELIIGCIVFAGMAMCFSSSSSSTSAPTIAAEGAQSIAVQGNSNKIVAPGGTQVELSNSGNVTATGNATVNVGPSDQLLNNLVGQITQASADQVSSYESAIAGQQGELTQLVDTLSSGQSNVQKYLSYGAVFIAIAGLIWIALRSAKH